MTDKNKKAAAKPPIGLKPRHLHDTARIKDIYAVMGGYIDAGKKIPKEWTTELYELSKATFNK